MKTEQFTSELGNLGVTTTNYRGHSVEEIAKMATEKLISVSDTAPEPLKTQAYAFQEACYHIISFYMKEMIKNHTCTVCNILETQGHKDLANIIRRL